MLGFMMKDWKLCCMRPLPSKVEVLVSGTIHDEGKLIPAYFVCLLVLPAPNPIIKFPSVFWRQLKLVSCSIKQILNARPLGHMFASKHAPVVVVISSQFKVNHQELIAGAFLPARYPVSAVSTVRSVIRQLFSIWCIVAFQCFYLSPPFARRFRMTCPPRLHPGRSSKGSV